MLYNWSQLWLAYSILFLFKTRVTDIFTDNFINYYDRIWENKWPKWITRTGFVNSKQFAKTKNITKNIKPRVFVFWEFCDISFSLWYQFSLVDMIEPMSIDLNILVKGESNQLIHLKYPARRERVIQTVQRGQEYIQGFTDISLLCLK